MLKLFRREVRYLSEALAAIAMFDMANRVRMHGRPIVACGECTVSKVASLDMVSTFSLVEFK